MMNAVSIGTGQLAVLEDNQQMAVLRYPKRLSTHAYIRLNNAEEYEIKPTNFWRTKFEVLQQGKTIIKLQSRWNGGFKIALVRQGSRLNLIFKSKSLWKIRYLLLDNNERLMADSRIKFQGLRLNKKLDIQIKLTDSLKRHKDCLLLTVLFVYLIRHSLKQTAIIVASS